MSHEKRLHPMRLRGWLLISLVLLVCLGLAGFTLFPGAPARGAGGLGEDLRLGADPVDGEFGASPALTPVEGRLIPRRWVALSLPFGARAEAVWVTEGQRVAAGERLVTLDGYEALAAGVASARLDVVLARQAVDDLYKTAGMGLARADVALALAHKEDNFRRDHLAGLLRPHPPLQISQAHANLLLAQERLERALEDLAKARQKFANKKNFIWHFINQRYVRLALNGLEAQVAYFERRAVDAQKKYDDLLAPVDAVLLAQAQANAFTAAARLRQAQIDREEYAQGPAPDLLRVAQAKLRAAEARLAATQVVLQGAELGAPLDGVVAALDVQAGQWIQPGRRMALVADLSEWLVETTDLSEDQVVGVQIGQKVVVRLDAYPEQTLSGQVESIGLVSNEEDGEVYYQVKIHLDSQIDGSRWGMRARVLFTASP